VTESQREVVPRADGGERDTALAFLAFARRCVLKKLDGLTDEQARRPMVASGTSLLGLVRHLTDGERYWFHHVVGGDARWADVDFELDASGNRATVVADYEEAVRVSDEVLARASFDQLTTVPVDDVPLSVRWVVAHMTSEVARHAGHADVLRELTDGVTGR
jgi:uncharacterized damage-inducible protein DinB